MTDEKTSPPIASVAGRVLRMNLAQWLLWAPGNLKAVKSLAATALTQTADRQNPPR